MVDQNFGSKREDNQSENGIIFIFSLQKVMDDLNGIMMGSFSQKDRLKYQKFEQNLKNFRGQIAELIRVHVKARYVNEFDMNHFITLIVFHAIQGCNQNV